VPTIALLASALPTLGGADTVIKPAVPDKFTQDVRACINEREPTWSRPELYAWNQLCLGADIDLNTLDGVTPYKDIDALAADKTRYLSEEFLNAILHRPRYRAKYALTRLHISHAYLQSLLIGNLSLDELIVDDSLIAGDIGISDSNVKYGVLINRCHGHGSLHFSNMTSAQLDIDTVTFDHLSVASSNLDSMHVKDAQFRKAVLYDNNISHQLDIETCTCSLIQLSHMSGNHVAIEATQLNELALTNVFFTNRIDISVAKWTAHGIDVDKDTDAPSDAIFNRVSAPKWKIDFQTYPQNVSVVESDVDEADLGDRPVEFLKHVDSGSSGYAPVFYTAAIKFYVNTSRGGVARDIQIRQRNIGRESTIGFDRLLLDISWAVIGYGFVVERGFLWIGAFVILGYFVFRTGAKQVRGAHVPDSWFYFTVDAVIPLISLNKQHEDVFFKGWRQHYLYFMKILGAALAFLVIGYVKQAFFDNA